MSGQGLLIGFSLSDPVLINTLGHTAGVLLFGLIITLILRSGQAKPIRDTRLSIVAAALALGWNAGCLIALGTRDFDSLPLNFIMAASYGLLSLLPAVLLQVTLHRQFYLISGCGYLISLVAVALHVAALFVASYALHQAALLLVSVGFCILTVLTFLRKRKVRLFHAGQRVEWLSLCCLLLLVISFPHFGSQHFRSSWAAEITWHHISIPVALVVLLQDYRFLLLDTFVRFLVNAGLAVLYVLCLLSVSQKLKLFNPSGNSMFLAGIALIALCLSLILFTHVRNITQLFIGRTLFHRQNLENRIRNINQVSTKTQSEDELVAAAASEVAAHLLVERFLVVSENRAPGKPDQAVVLLGSLRTQERVADISWAEAQIPLRFSSGEVRYLLLGQRRGRQRYLSEDLEDMRRLASVIVEQVERFRSEELKHLAIQAELRALQAQINPHFLFNAFNTLYGTIDRGSFEARRLVLNLTDIFRYFLQSDRLVIPLSEEIRIVRAYLEIESLRLGDRLEIQIDVGDSALEVLIPTLSIQPLVENAVKHGVAAKLGSGRVVLRAHTEGARLYLTVEDTNTSGVERDEERNGSGMGLANVRRRLALTYGLEATLDALYGAYGSIVSLVIPAPTVVRSEMSLPPTGVTHGIGGERRPQID